LNPKKFGLELPSAISRRDHHNFARRDSMKGNVLLPRRQETAREELAGLTTRAELAKRLRLSNRSIDNLQRQRKIPYIKISPRCVRFDLQAVLRALSRFEVIEAGRLRKNSA
jgi:hypothetical protein